MANDPLHQAANVAKSLATKPLEALDAVLGTPERFVEGTLAHGGDIGHGAYEAFHPRDMQTRQKNLATIEQDLGVGGAKGLGKAGVDFGVQMMLDPLTYIPFIGGGRWLEKGLTRLAEAVPIEAKAHPVVQQTMRFFTANPELDDRLSKNGKNVYLGIYASEREKIAHELQKDALLIAKNKKALLADQMTPDLTKRLDELAYVHGDQDMRNQVLQRGFFRPTPEQAAQAPTGFLPHYNLLEDYKPEFESKTNIPSELVAEQPFTMKRYSGDVPTPYAKPKTGNATPESSLYDRMQSRLWLAQNRIFEEAMNKRLLEELGGPAAADFNRVQELRQAGQGLGQQKMRGFAPLDWLSNAYRQALFVNPLPHMFNIARLTYLAGGAGTVGRGLRYLATGTPKEIAEQAAQKVGTPLYLAGEGGMFDKIPGLRKIRDVGQHGLTAFDRAMRQAYLAELMKGGKEATYEMGQQVRSGIGDYGRSSQAVQIARAAGAPFAQWRLGIVPGAVGRATLRNPERVERYARGMMDASQNTKTPFEFSGPEEDFAKLATAPYGTARYIMSPSTIGPVLSQLHNLAGLGGTPDTRKMAEQILRSYVPGGGSIEEAFGLSPYKEGDQKKLNFLLSLFGGYTKPAGSP